MVAICLYFTGFYSYSRSHNFLLVFALWNDNGKTVSAYFIIILGIYELTPKVKWKIYWLILNIHKSYYKKTLVAITSNFLAQSHDKW